MPPTTPPTVMLYVLLCCPSACDASSAPPLAKRGGTLELGEWVPRIGEQDAIGRVRSRLSRETSGFRQLARCTRSDMAFKDEESTGADRYMTARLQQRLVSLNRLVQREWAGVTLRVTEAWDEDGEHGPTSAHYEGRAADLTTSDLDSTKLGRLAFLAVEAGLDWVYFEDRTHVHVSVRR